MKPDDLKQASKLFCESINIGFTPEFFVMGLSSGNQASIYSLTPQHAKRLQQYLQDLPGGQGSTFIRFPNRESQIGKLINDYLASTAPTDINDHTIHLLFSANRWEAKEMIQQTLESGVSIVCDRYAYR